MPLDDPMTWVFTIAVGLLGLVLNLLIIYLVIRLAITHGMLSYSRQLSEDRLLPIHRD